VIRRIAKYLTRPFRKSVFEKFLGNIRVQLQNLQGMFGEDQLVRLLPWIASGFNSPAPNIVKWHVMKKWGGRGTWIETGTYLGETTLFLADVGKFVISLEPADQLYQDACLKFASAKNIHIVHGTSESSLASCVDNLEPSKKEDLTFWLDGHYSAGLTYLGEQECPVLFELETIGASADFTKPLTILIDDVRGFSRTGELNQGFPSLSFLANWADSRRLYWVIEHDIFIMTNREVQD